MSIKQALKGQYHSGLAMMRGAIELCPEETWLKGEHPRNFWRIAYHAVFYTHFYLTAGEDALTPWERHRASVRILWEDDEDGLPAIEPAYSQAEMLDYLALLDAQVDQLVDAFDLDRQECGFSWYSMPKLDHQLLNLRHLQHHVGQLCELLLAEGIEVRWK